MAVNPFTNVTFYGRLSYPTWTAQEAFDLSLKGSYPQKDVASTSPSFQLLVTQAQFEKVRDFAVNTFLPYCVEQHKKGENKDSLEPKEAKLLIDGITGDLADQVYNSPFKLVSDKTADLAPEAVAAVKILGQKGRDFELRAAAFDEDDLRVPDPNILTWPAIVPIAQSVHEMYPGCVVGVTANLYAYKNGKLPGFSAGASVAVFRGDAERFGGSVGVDVDEIFLD